MKLNCPECGDPLIAAHGRGRYDKEGNFVEHRESCRCPHCEWVWFDDAEPVGCPCGALVRVVEDDGYAYAQTVERRRT